MKIVLIFIGVLLPFYVLLVISGISYISSIENQAVQSAQSILDINTNQLQLEMERIDAMYYELQSNNPDFQRLRSYNGSDENKLSLFRVNQTLRLQSPMISAPSALYLYLRNADILLFLDNAHEAGEVIALRQEVKNSDCIRTVVNWSLDTIMDRPWILHTLEEIEMFYGAMIDLNQIMEKIQNEIPYEHVSVSLTDAPGNAQALRVSSRLPSVRQYFTVELDRTEIRESMGVLSAHGLCADR
jgi:hypothetical protein